MAYEAVYRISGMGVRRLGSIYLYRGWKNPVRAFGMLLLSGALFLVPTQAQAQTVGPHKRVIRSHATNQITGTDGSQTGTANFQGNFTTISASSGQALALYRQSNCSLTMGTGTYNVGAGTYAQTALTMNYERTLHTEAGLTTTADVFAKKCILAPTTGLNSTPFAFVGDTTKGVGVLATVGYNGTSESLYIASGVSTYTETNFAFAAAGALSTADLNGDGNGDLVVTNNSISTNGGAVTILIGNADGTFKTGVTYATAGTGTDAVVIDDFNGDGKLDLATLSDTAQQTQQISILLGNGDGTFNAAQSFAAPTLPGYTTTTPASGLISGDFRNSGKKDILLSNGAELLGNGDGTFTAAATPAFPYFAVGNSVNFATADINNDGKLDVVVSLGTSVTIYTGNGDGTFTSGNSYLTIGSTGYVVIDDLDGDGNPDIYVGLGDGGVFIGDSYDPNLSYALMGHGDGTFDGAPAIQPPSGGENQVLSGYTGANLADVNGDGYPDLVVLSSVDTYNVLLGSSTGAYHVASTIQVPASITLYGQTVTGAAATTDSAVVDLNGDGKPDLVFLDSGLNPYSPNGGNAQSLMAVYFVALGNGDGTFKTPVAYPFPQIAPSADVDINPRLSNLMVGDITGSGHGDMIMGFTDTVGGTGVAEPYIGGFVVLAGNGDGTFSGTPLLTTTASSATAPNSAFVPLVSALSDLNADKKLDLLTVTSIFTPGTGGSTQLQELLGNGDGTFQTASNVNVLATGVQSSTYTLLLTDFNNDGKLDLACLNETYTDSNAQLAIALGNGDGTFQPPTLSNLSGGDSIRSSGIAAADFDGDGKVDLALLEPGALSGIYYGHGDGTFTSVPANGNSFPKDLINLTTEGSSIGIDLNKDGKPDILSGSGILLNTYGSTTVTPPAASTTTLKASAASVTVGTNVTFTATVAGASGSSGTPSGTVTFLDGTTTLGTGTLASGVATYATGALAIGSHSITAQYGGDMTFAASTSSAVAVTVTAVAPTFTLGASPTSLSIAAAGSSGTTTLTVTPAGSFAQPVSFACAALPYEATCTFAPTTVTPGSSAATTVLTISTTAAHVVKSSGNDRSALKGLGTLASLALLILTFRPGGRGRARWLVALVTLSAGAVLLGCGSSKSGGGGANDPGTPVGTNTVTVTATAGSFSQTVALSVAVK